MTAILNNSNTLRGPIPSGVAGLGCGCNCGGKCGGSMSGIIEDVGGWKKLAISMIITGVVYGIGYYRGLNAKK